MFVAGDVTIVPFRQIVIAVGEGAKASLGAFDYLIRTSFDDDTETAEVKIAVAA